jgi:hypothetical protein
MACKSDELAILDEILAEDADPSVRTTMIANLQKPDIQAVARAMFGLAPTSIEELSLVICTFLMAPVPSTSSRAK